MAKLRDVANFFIEWANNCEDEAMTNMRLNKLVYYAQGHSLAENSKELFEDDIQAWKYGPIVPELYKQYSKYGKKPISGIDPDYSVDNLTREEQLLLSDILFNYGMYSGMYLSNLTHKKGTPWEEVYKENENNVITKDEMKKFFSRPENALKPFIVNRPPIGYRDTDGYLVIPSDEEDEDNYEV